MTDRSKTIRSKLEKASLALLFLSVSGLPALAQEKDNKNSLTESETIQAPPSKEKSKSIEALKQSFIKFDLGTAFSILPGVILKTSRGKDDLAQENKTLAKSFIYTGYAFLLDSNPEAALNCFKTALTLDPDSLVAKCYYSECLKQLCLFEEQEKVLSELAGLENKTGFVYEQLAEDRLRKNNGKVALALIESGLDLKNCDSKMYLLILKAKALALLGMGNRTKKAYEQAAQFTENPYMKEILLADAALIGSDLKNTKQHILNAKKILPDDPIWQYKLGNYYAGDNNSTKAAEYLLSSTVTQRLSATAYTNLASHYSYQAQFKNALKAIGHIKSLLPSNASLIATEGDINKRYGKWQEALEDYDQALKLDPTLSRTYHDIASIYIGQKRKDQALETYQRALSLMPYYWRLHLNHAEILWRLKLYNQAKDECLAGLNLLSSNADDLNILANHYKSRAHAMLSAYYFRKNDNKNAIIEAIRFNETKYIPELPQALSYLKLRPERLIFISDQSMQDPLILVALGDVFFELKDYDQSEKLYRQAISLSPEDADLHSYLLNVLTHKSDWGEAAKENFTLSGKLVNKIPQEMGKWFSPK